MHRIRKAFCGVFAALALAAGAAVAAPMHYANAAQVRPSAPSFTWQDTALFAFGLNPRSYTGPITYSANRLAVLGSPGLTGFPDQWQITPTHVPTGSVAIDANGSITSTGATAVTGDTANVTVFDGYGDAAAVQVTFSVSNSTIAVPVTITSLGTTFYTNGASVSILADGLHLAAATHGDAVPSVPDSIGFTSTDLPAGLTVTGGGFIGLGTAAPGTYTVVVKAADTSLESTTGDQLMFSSATETFVLKVEAHKVFNDKVYNGTVTDFSGLCLDVKNAFGHAAAGQLLQVWSCGAAGGEDQVFRYDTSAQTLTYGGLCVAETSVGGHASLQACGSTGTAVNRSGKLYRFGDGTVLDVRGFGKTSGTQVLTWDHNGGANQDWSLPK